MQIHVNKDCVFDYVNPPPLNHKLLLLTKDNVMVVGAWKGGPPGDNKTYKAWCGLPDRDKVAERALGYL